MQQVVNFFPDGTVELTRSELVDTLFDGVGEMVRVTDIIKYPYGNEYMILWKVGPFAKSVHTYGYAAEYQVRHADKDLVPNTNTGKMHFVSYAAAVRHEVQMLNAMRLAGVRFSAP